MKFSSIVLIQWSETHHKGHQIASQIFGGGFHSNLGPLDQCSPDWPAKCQTPEAWNGVSMLLAECLSGRECCSETANFGTALLRKYKQWLALKL